MQGPNQRFNLTPAKAPASLQGPAQVNRIPLGGAHIDLGDGRMRFDLSITIQRSPDDVFRFLRDKDKYPQEPGSPVLVLEQTTPGPVGVGTHYREVVQMFPFIRGEFLSVITRFEPGKHLEEDFEGVGMAGHLAYHFLPEGDGTRLVQQEYVRTRGLARLLEPILERMLLGQLWKRLRSIKTVLEEGWEVSLQ